MSLAETDSDRTRQAGMAAACGEAWRASYVSFPTLSGIDCLFYRDGVAVAFAEMRDNSATTRFGQFDGGYWLDAPKWDKIQQCHALHQLPVFFVAKFCDGMWFLPHAAEHYETRVVGRKDRSACYIKPAHRFKWDQFRRIA